MQAEDIKKLIESGLSGSSAQVDGDGRHWNAVVVSASFEGKNMLAQHRLVYGALGDSFDTEALHALSLKTYTPSQWEATRS
jgi:acid stress-induced BolA-like protein IbaG/YrbA